MNKNNVLLESQNVVLNIKADTKAEAIKKIVDALTVENKAELLNAVLNREAMASTGLENGVALPHAKSSLVKKTHIGVGICPSGVDFDSMDGEPAKIIVLVISPLLNDTAHVMYFAGISSLLSNKAVREKLINATEAESVLEIINQIC